MNREKFYDGAKPQFGFEDVLIRPAHSDIESRYGDHIQTSTELVRGKILLGIPILSAGMDSVSGGEMAEEMALSGGMAEIHRNCSVQDQGDMVQRVKERMRIIEDHPPSIPESGTIRDALSVLKKRERGYVIVYPNGKNGEDGVFVGMATMKDFLAGNPDDVITSVMTPLYPNSSSEKQTGLITAPVGTSLEEAVAIMKKNRIEKLPILYPDERLFGVYTTRDYEFIRNFPYAAKDALGRLLVGAAIGAQSSDYGRSESLIRAGVDMLFVDIAHGDSDNMKKMLHRLYDLRRAINSDVPICAGNIVTASAANDLAREGVAVIKVGIGPGAACTTRDVAGTGMPQISAIHEVREMLEKMHNPPTLIADGGVRKIADIPKAIVAGADAVMIGGFLAGTDKSPGNMARNNAGILVKKFRGMASKSAQEDRKNFGDSTTNSDQYVAEGKETEVLYKGPTKDVIKDIVGGLRSSMSYTNSHTIYELQQAQLNVVSPSASNENGRALS